tara:strand:+ start:4192 stop:4485 length:294 start_codon:yes stop_codon:yes gene_type:complete
MYTINNAINLTKVKGLNASKLLDISATEVLHISLEKGGTFPTHTSPTDAHLILLEGVITFFIEDQEFEIQKHQVFDFEKNKEHHLKAHKDSKFLIIR